MQIRDGIRSALLILFVACSPVFAASVQKWTDAQGNVHYGDSPPPGASVQAVRVDAPPPSRNPAPVYVPTVPATQTPVARSIEEERRVQQAEAEKRNRDGLAGAAAAEARTRALNDKALVDRCRAERNNYCNAGVDVIRQKNYERDLLQAADQQSAAIASGRVLPPAQRIQPTPPCQWPQDCTSKKKK